jgi:NAD(P)H-hydrate repair Nnr-like enzyme with NAD(P)H-hydrate epimerase domain
MADKLEKVNDTKLKALKNSKLSPGSVKVRVLTSSIVIDQNGLMNIIVDGVLGYGPATPVISKSDSLTLKVNDSQKEKILKNDENVILVIKNLPSGRGEETNNIWKLISIEE